MAVFERAMLQHFAPNPFSKQGSRIERMVDGDCRWIGIDAGTPALISRGGMSTNRFSTTNRFVDCQNFRRQIADETKNGFVDESPFCRQAKTGLV
jgi:hypothetical protein